MLYHVSLDSIVNSTVYSTWTGTDSFNFIGNPPRQYKYDCTLQIPTSEAWNDLVNTHKKEIAYLPSYPPCDCWMKEDFSKLYYKFALAGFDKNEVTLTAVKNQFTLTCKKQDDDERKLIHHGISRKEIDIIVRVDKDYDPLEAETEFKEGMLFISIPRSKKSKVKKLL